MANTRLDLEVGFKIDRRSYQQVLDSLEKVTQAVNDAMEDPDRKDGLSQQFIDAGKAAEDLYHIMDRSWDHKIGQVNLSKLNTEFKKCKTTAVEFYNKVAQGGAEGKQGADAFARGLMEANVELVKTSKLVDKMAVTFGNTIRYGISSSIFNTFTNSIRNAYEYTKQLDTSLNDIRIVSGKSANEMADLAVQANKAAQALGKTTLDYTKAATIFYQQGLDTDEVEKRTEVVLKAANVTGQSAQEVSEQLTAVWNGYQVGVADLELYVDKLSAVAASSASNLEELSTGMSKVASAANVMGVDIDQLTAQMSTIISVTRQAPESVGTALRTIYARIADIKAGIDGETTLGNYSGKMKKLGFDVLDASGNLKDMGNVIEEIGGKWETLTREQQVSLAQTMAGTRQYNNLLTLFDNWDKYTDALNTSKTAAGKLQQQQDIYMESTEAHIKQMQAEAEELYATLFNQEAAKVFFDVVTNGLKNLNGAIKLLGGGLGTFAGLGAQVVNMFSSKIADSYGNFIEKRQTKHENKLLFKNQDKIADEVLKSHASERQDELKSEYEKDQGRSAIAQEAKLTKDILKVKEKLTQEDFKRLTAEKNRIALLEDEKRKIKDQYDTNVLLRDNKDKWNKLGKVKGLDINSKGSVGDSLLTQEEELEKLAASKGKGTPEQQEKAQAKYEEQEKIVQLLRERLELLQAIDDEENEIKDKEKEQTALTEDINKSTKNAGRKLDAQNVLKFSTAALQGLTVVTGAIGTFADETSTAEDKANALYNGIVGAGAAAANAFLPGSGALVQLAGGLLDNLGLTKALAEAFKSAAEREQEEIDRLRNLSESMNKRYEELSGQVKDLANQWDNYTSVIDILNKCTIGTKEWNDALIEVNKTIADILKQYPGLAQINGIVKIGENGQLQLDEALYAEYVQKLQNEALISQYTGIAATNNANRRQLQLDKSNLNEKAFEEIAGATKLSDTDFENLINLAANNPAAYYDEIDNMYERLLNNDHVLVDKEDADEFSYFMKKNINSFADLYTKTEKYNTTLVNSMKILAASQYDMSGPSALKTALYVSSYQNANKSTEYTAKELHDYWAYKEWTDRDGKKHKGIDIAQSTGKDDSEYQELIDDINRRLGYEKYSKAREVEDEDITVGQDASKGISLYNNDLNKDETFDSLKDLADYVHEIETVRKSLKTDIEGDADETIKELSAKTGIDVDTLEKVFSDNFNIQEFDQETAEKLQSHKDDILGAYQDITKDIQDETAKMVVDDIEQGISNQLDTAWDVDAHAEILKQKFKETLQAAASGAAEEFDLDKDDIEKFGQHLASLAKQDDKADLADTLEKNGKAVSFVAQSILRMNRAVEDLNKNQEEWISNIKKSDRASEEYWRAVEGLQDAFGDLLNLTKDAQEYLDGDFFKENAEKIEAAANGSAEAIDELRQATLQKIVATIEINTKDYTREKLEADVQNLQSLIDNMDLKLEPGVEIDDEQFLKALNEMITAAGFTSEQVNSLLSGMGYEPTIVMENETVDGKIPVTTKHHYVTKRKENKDGSQEYDEVETVSTEYVDTDSTLGVFAMKGGPEGKSGGTPKVTKITKGAGGSSNNYSSRNKGGKSLGKGGGGSSSKPSKKDPNKDELDRYQLVNVQLKEISKELNKLDKEKEKLLGGKLLDNLNNKIKLLNDQITVTDAKLKIAQQEQSEVADKLAGYGIKFDSQGNIANYAQIFKQEQAKLNAVYDAFNGMSKDAQDSYEDTVKAAEETWNTFKDSITKYDNLIGDMIPSLYQEIQDAFDAQTEIFIEELNMEVKLRLDTSSMLRDWNDFKRKVIDGIKDDDILGTAKAKLADFESYYNAEGTAEIQALTKRLQQQLEEVRKQDASGSAEWYRDNRAKAIEDLEEHYKNIKDSLLEIIKLEEEMQQKVLDMMNETQEKFDEQIESFENVNKYLEHNVELINLLTDKNDYEQLAKQYEAQTKNREQELDFYTKQKDYWENYLKTLEEGSKEWEAAKDKYNSAAEAWASALETTIKAARTEFENNINLIFKNINDQLTDNKGLDYLNTEWELLADNSNMVLDNINKMQKFQDLTQKYNDAINSTSNIAAQKKLAQLRDQELAALKEIDNINEKDLERAEKKLDIVKAQIALEDAQRNKTQMRLRRDSQGNYRYQFVADEEEVQKAQQELANAYNELYNFDKERYKSNLNDAYAAWNEYQEKMTEAALINDPEVRGQREELLTKEYNERILILTEENEKIKQELNESTIAELNSLYAQNADNYDLMTEEQKAALSDYEAANQTAFDLIFDLYTENTEKFHNMTQDQLDVIENQMIPQWTSGYQTLIDKIEGEGGIEEVSANLAEQLHNEAEEYQNDLNDIEVAAGQTFGEISDVQNDIIENTKDMLEANDGLIDKYTEMTDAVMDQYTALKDLMNEYEQAANDAKQAAEDAYNYIMKDKNKQAEEAKENVDAGPTTGGTGNYNPTSTQTSTPTPAKQAESAKPSLEKGSYVEVKSGTRWYANSYGGGASGKAWAGTIKYINLNGSHPYNLDGNGWIRKQDIVGYDTGGYTGTWGRDGRVAMLHEKELILNKEDTANMLNAVEILRGITENISADVLGKIAGASSIGINGSMGNGVLDQNVHITATFPGVQSSIEIQDALNNLVNMAAQRAQVK